jgi:hypothetical protein
LRFQKLTHEQFQLDYQLQISFFDYNNVKIEFFYYSNECCKQNFHIFILFIFSHSDMIDAIKKTFDVCIVIEEMINID